MTYRAALRRTLRSTLLWALLCAVIAVPFFVTERGMGFWPFLLALVCGLLLGTSFVNLTFRLRSQRLGALLHVAGAFIAGGALFSLMRLLDDLAEAIARPVAGGLLFVQIALGPATGWVALALLSRITSRLAPKPTTPPQGPAWHRDPDGWRLECSAIPLRMSTLTWVIVTVVVVAGTLTAILLIALDDWVTKLGSYVAIVLIALVVGLPSYLVVSSAWKRRTLPVTVTWLPDALRLSAGSSSWTLPLREIEMLRWREDSEYARIEVRSTGVELSLIVGLARPAQGIAPTLPPLRQSQIRTLEDAGLSCRRSRGAGRTALFVRGREPGAPNERA